MNPVTISLSQQKVSISEIPFPKVTICPESKADKEKIDLSSSDLGRIASGIKHSNMTALKYEHFKIPLKDGF